LFLASSRRPPSPNDSAGGQVHVLVAAKLLKRKILVIFLCFTELEDLVGTVVAPQCGAPVHFLHIRKTGGTAIIEALRPVAQPFRIVLHAHDTKLGEIPPDHKVFFFVRHPVPRFVSGFFSRLRRGAPRYNYEWNDAEARAFSRFQTPSALGEALSATN